MKKPEIELGERAYKPEHIKEVLEEVKNNFEKYFEIFCESCDNDNGETIDFNKYNIPSNVRIIRSKPNRKKYGENLSRIYEAEIASFKNEQYRYKKFLDLDTLKEYEDDPSAFKKEMERRCPIVRRCLQSEEEEMKKFQSAFRKKAPQELLNVTSNIMSFGREFDSKFNDNEHEKVSSVDELNLGMLLEDDYKSYEVIGGGIQSHFLFMIYPNAFAYRSQNAIWSLYFLTDKKHFGFEDDSEFIYIDEKYNKVQQNYFYPYDIFTFYALKIYLLLKKICEKNGYDFENKHRYIYLNTFFNSIAKYHKKDIDTFKGKNDE